jgi:cytoskeleton protein RodZ
MNVNWAGMAPLTANTTSMDHFGEALRCERQRRSVSLEDIAQTTKVTVRSLKALEADAFDQLPGGILSKGIVRSYVRCLGLDESEWVARFLDASEQKIEPAPIPPQKDWGAFPLNLSTAGVRAITDATLRWAGVAVLLLLLAGFGWIVWGYVHQRVASLSPPPASYSVSSVTPAVSGSTKRSRKAHVR